MKIVIAGASGAVGSALLPELRAGGHEPLRLVRRAPRAPDEISWDPAKGALDPARLAGVEAIVNLAGENIGKGRWTAERRERILGSRVEATRTLVGAMARMERRPAVLLSTSAVGIYGDRGEEILTEASAAGSGFLPQVCLAWEAEARRAEKPGVRVALLRFAVIVSRGGVLERMLPLFRLGLGGPLGSGEQWMTWVSMADATGAIAQALRDERFVGPINIAAPAAVTNAEFARALGRVLHRPAILPAPAWALRVVFGRAMANEALLASQRAAPARLNENGYEFRHRSLESALRAALANERSEKREERE